MATPLLHHDRISAPSADPDRWLLVLHGIYGAGRNWNTVARRFVEARPDWGAVPVDLREHGDSAGFDPPHDLAAAAGDVRALARSEVAGARALLGHSFGGKVGLVYAADAGGGLEWLWVVDSSPDAHEPSGSAWEMLAVLKALPDRFPSRDDGVEALVSRGIARPVAMWMGTNLVRDEAGVRWRIDPDAMESLLGDFFRTDAWGVVEDPPGDLRVHFIKAEDSSILDADAVARIEEAGRRNGRVFLHRVAGGHWLNTDNPDAVVELLAAEM